MAVFFCSLILCNKSIASLKAFFAQAFFLEEEMAKGEVRSAVQITQDMVWKYWEING